MSFARNSASYCPRPRLLSQPPTSMAALHGPERIILRLKRPVQGRAVEGLDWVIMTQRHCRSQGQVWASGRIPAVEAERPLSVQSRDLRGDARQWARRADSGPSRPRPEKWLGAWKTDLWRSNLLLAAHPNRSYHQLDTQRRRISSC